MKCIILAAGYATRLYPLTKNFPKPLLKVKGRAIIDWIISDLETIPDIDEYIIVSNHKFYDVFNNWLQEADYSKTITILDDGSVDNDNRLGAVRDIAFAIKSKCIEDDIIVLAGDNLTDFSFSGFVSYYRNKQASCVMRHFEPSEEKLKKTGVAVIDENEKLLVLQEKPDKPASNWAVPPFYIYRSSDLSYIEQAVEENICNMDAPGNFIQWFCSEHTVYAYEMPGKRYDIGDLNSYEYVNKHF